FDGSRFYGNDENEIDMDFINKTVSELKFNLCDVEIKFHVDSDRELAIRKLKLATSLGNSNAKALLKK
ncbi:657_t:CDS:2, partial [Racocetra fulgida]